MSVGVMLYMALTELMPPRVEEFGRKSSVGAYFHILFTMKLIHILGMMIAFDGLCNFYAELGDFADRQFYQDWWNCTDSATYNRRWNRPVHEYLYRHIFLEGINRYKAPRSLASAAAFFYSSLLHEPIVFNIFGFNPSFYIFSMMMGQLTLLHIAPLLKVPPLTQESRFGMLFFWFCEFGGENFFVYQYLLEMKNFSFP